MSSTVRELVGARVLVTGGCGLIGVRIGRLLSAYGAEAVAFDSMGAYPFDYADEFGATEIYHEIVHGDVVDAPAVRRAMDGADFVIHAAAYADVAACTANVAESTRTNVLGTQTILDAIAEARPRRFVYVSSASVYGNGPRPDVRQCWSEDTPTAPISVYANAKLWGEWQTRLQLSDANVDHVSLRYFSVYGEPQVPKPNSHSWCVAWFGLRAALGLPLQLNHAGRQIRDFTHVDDVAEATVRALVAPEAAGQIINVGTGIATSVAEVAALVAAEFPGSRTVVAPGPPDDPMGGFADTTLMRGTLGFSPRVEVSEGVRRYVRWLKGSDLMWTLESLLTEDAEVRAAESGVS